MSAQISGQFLERIPETQQRRPAEGNGGPDMEVMPLPIGGIYPDRKARPHSERRKKSSGKGQDRGSAKPEIARRSGQYHIDLTA